MLEASVAELHQMFLDFALLPEEQGELLDQIEYQAKFEYQAPCYEEDVHLHNCSKFLNCCDFAFEIRRIRRIQCCIIITCLVIIGIIVAIVIGTQTAQGKLAIASVKGRRV